MPLGVDGGPGEPNRARGAALTRPVTEIQSEVRLKVNGMIRSVYLNIRLLYTIGSTMTTEISKSERLSEFKPKLANFISDGTVNTLSAEHALQHDVDELRQHVQVVGLARMTLAHACSSVPLTVAPTGTTSVVNEARDGVEAEVDLLLLSFPSHLFTEVFQPSRQPHLTLKQTFARVVELSPCVAQPANSPAASGVFTQPRQLFLAPPCGMLMVHPRQPRCCQPRSVEEHVLPLSPLLVPTHLQDSVERSDGHVHARGRSVAVSLEEEEVEEREPSRVELEGQAGRMEPVESRDVEGRVDERRRLVGLQGLSHTSDMTE